MSADNARRGGSELSEGLGSSFRSETPMACTHTKWVYDPPYENDWTGEWITPEPRQVSTSVDIDIGRFRCTQCGEVGYYTGLWRDFHEKGIPCPGSDGVRRMARVPEVDMPPGLTEAEMCGGAG